MPHTISDLISSRNLSEADVNATLAAAGLPLDAGEYSDEDIRDKFDAVRGLFDERQVSDYDSAKEMFASQTASKSSKGRSPKVSTESNKNRKSQKNSTPNSNSSLPPSTSGQQGSVASEDSIANSGEAILSVSELLNRAKELLGLKLTLKEALSILESCGLADKEYYTEVESDRFIATCGIVTNGGTQDIGSRLQDATAAVEMGLIGLVNEVTSERAKHIPALVNQLYMQNVALSLAENEGQIESFFLQLKNSILEGVEGKSPLRSIVEVEWTQAALPESPPLPNPSLKTSENGMIVDMTKESNQDYKP